MLDSILSYLSRDRTFDEVARDLEDVARTMAMADAKAHEVEVGACLERWESELEPQRYFAPGNVFLGLTIAGIPIGERAPLVVATSEQAQALYDSMA